MSIIPFCYHYNPAFLLFSSNLFPPVLSSYLLSLCNMVWLLLTYLIILLLSPQVFVSSFLSYPLYFHFHLLFSLSKGIFHHFVLLPAPFIFSPNKEPALWLYVHECLLSFTFLFYCLPLFYFYLLSSYTNNLNNICKHMLIYLFCTLKNIYGNDIHGAIHLTF